MVNKKDILLEEYKLASSNIQSASKFFWDRFSIFTTINFALLTVYNLGTTEKIQIIYGIYLILIPIVSFIICIGWFFILIRMHTYQTFYEIRAKELESALKHPNIYSGYDKVFSKKNTWIFQRCSSNEIGIFISGFFVFVWWIIFLVSLSIPI